MKQTLRIRCPKCDWEPNEASRWMCSVCRTTWNTFNTRAICPTCGKRYEDTICLKSRGGCGEISPHEDWYSEEIVEIPEKTSSLLFWKNKRGLPVTDMDKQWTENGLLFLEEIVGKEYFQLLTTITSDKKYIDRQFNGTKDDAEYVFKRISTIMHIDPWEIQLKYYSNKPIEFTDGLFTTPQEKLKGSWDSSSGWYVDNGLGHKEIWLEINLLKEPASLISTLSHELAHYKLLSEHHIENNDEALTDLAAIAFGFGIFRGNNYFKFSRWYRGKYQGWQMQRRGYLPEQMIAYAMAWLAHYRNEDIAWKQYLNKTVRKYFEQSYTYITQNKENIKGLN